MRGEGVRSRAAASILALWLASLGCRTADPVAVSVMLPATVTVGAPAPVASAVAAPKPSASARIAPPLVQSAPIEIGAYMHVGRMVLFEGAVYFIGYGPSNGAILKASIHGSEAVLLHLPMEDPDSIVPTRSGVYYHDVDTHGVFRVPLRGGRPVTVADADDGSLGGDGTRAVWSNGGDLYTTTGSRPVKLASGVGVVQWVVADADAIYWISEERHAIERLRPPRRQPEQVTAAGKAGGLTLDASYLYYFEDGSLKRVPKAGGMAEVLLGGRDDLSDVTVDGAYAYVTVAKPSRGEELADGGGDDGSILRIPLSGGPFEVVASGLPSPRDIASDAESIYFSARRDHHVHAIMKLPKP